MTEILEAVLRRDRWIAGGGIALLVLMAWAWLLEVTRGVRPDSPVLPPLLRPLLFLM